MTDLRTAAQLAQEAGFETKRDMVFVDSWEITRSIERLVALARADERERIRAANAPVIQRINDHLAQMREDIRARSKA